MTGHLMHLSRHGTLPKRLLSERSKDTIYQITLEAGSCSYPIADEPMGHLTSLKMKINWLCRWIEGTQFRHKRQLSYNLCQFVFASKWARWKFHKLQNMKASSPGHKEMLGQSP